MASSPVRVTIEYPKELSRLHLLAKVFLGGIYVGIPHGIALGVYALLVCVVQIIAFFAILFTGKFPRGMFDFTVGYYRWSTRVNAYMGLMRDEYPPFNGKE